MLPPPGRTFRLSLIRQPHQPAAAGPATQRLGMEPGQQQHPGGPGGPGAAGPGGGVAGAAAAAHGCSRRAVLH